MDQNPEEIRTEEREEQPERADRQGKAFLLTGKPDDQVREQAGKKPEEKREDAGLSDAVRLALAAAAFTTAGTLLAFAFRKKK